MWRYALRVKRLRGRRSNNFGKRIGVDASDVAIEKAHRVLSMGVDKARRTQFIVPDIPECESLNGFPTIFFREFIYHVPQHWIRSMLEGIPSIFRI